MRFARGPFWLGSISKLTRSPPASESKFTLESSPVRWKKYSRPSSAAMNPKPRSETSFFMVPVGISLLLFSKAFHANARALSRRIDDRGEHRPMAGDRSTLTPGFRNFIPHLQGQKSDPEQGRSRPQQLQRGASALVQLPHAPAGDRQDCGLAHGRHHGQRRDAQGGEHEEVPAPHEYADHRGLPPGDLPTLAARRRLGVRPRNAAVRQLR